MAHTTIHGNLATNPRIYDTDHGKVAQLRVIENPRWRDSEGEWQKGEPEGHNVVVWGADAEHCACLRSGDTVLVEGYSYIETWTDEEGQQRRTTKVRATHIGASLRFVTAIFDRSSEPMGKRTPLRTRTTTTPPTDDQ